MKIINKKSFFIILLAILIILVPLVDAAPLGTTESAVLEAAQSWIGVKEVHGGDNRTGIDCSHLVYEVYKQAGVQNIVFQTVPNMKQNKFYVTTNSPAPGDVIFWKNDVKENNRTYWLATHVGIYIGNGQFIHPDRKVKIDTISGVYLEGMPYYARWESNGDDSSLPVASFSASPNSGSVPLTVSFSDTSRDASSLSWDFGDGNTSTEKNPVHTYSTAGNYPINLTVSNANGTNSKLDNIIVSEPLPQSEQVHPLADFNANMTSGNVPLTVQFIDSSQNATGWSWDFGDGSTSNEQNPVHTYSTAGNYDVNLVVSNAIETSSKSATITVQSPSSSDSGSSDGSSSESSSGGSSDSSSGSSSSSGGSSGGAGGSPEPQSNVEAKELSQNFISSGKPIVFDFPQKATPVVNISFDSKKTSGKTTTIVEMLKNQSTLVSGVPSETVYKFINIWVGNGGYGDSKNIENSVVCFKVKKSWIQDNKIDESSITLNRYSDTKWNALSTILSGEDAENLYFKGETVGFSSFAITAKITSNDTLDANQAGTQTVLSIGSLEKNENNTTNVKLSSEKTQNSNIKTSGFETITGIICLLSAFMYKKR